MAESPVGHVLHWARWYDLGTALSRRRIRRIQQPLLQRAAIAPGGRVLDVGCGPGRLALEAERAAGPAGRVLGIDPSPEMIALARRKGRQRHSAAVFQVAPMQAIPAPDSSFDVALASLVLHHVPAERLAQALAEVLRVLEPGGRFVALDFAASGRHGFEHFLEVVGLRRGFAWAEQLRASVAAAGFTGVKVERVGRAHCLIWGRKAG
jgi:demethylmenaquinone methyltransferase/2-methoxy-6-polyprenyl-1,4-benzoquinol methylase